LQKITMPKNGMSLELCRFERNYWAQEYYRQKIAPNEQRIRRCDHVH
jgi:hypothetical protein